MGARYELHLQQTKGSSSSNFGCTPNDIARYSFARLSANPAA
eukprot:NODE_3577_length_428_cov_10.585752_g3143_i0.p6 GENE.NODE_3577_length_428_cov_10.585752_g3143_i0~~NODE_3577_length_428_cov_10.585752_g3143_i0.p6  ORF type:complete len:50 (+),score=19.51 NODE_3577_length_428_cov_10.585752_g3143_i0:25-150(+)